MPVLIVVLHVGPGLQQHAHHLLVAAGTRVPGVQILFTVENIFYFTSICVKLSYNLHERRVAGAGLRVHICAVRDEQPHDIRVA